jgi:hypothetical protein
MGTQTEYETAHDEFPETRELPERTGPRVVYSKVTGYPYVTARPGAPKVTSGQIKKLLEDFP